MDDLISRQAAIDEINRICPVDTEYDCTLLDRVDVVCVLSDLPSVQPEPHYDEWCYTCKEYAHERHCCPRWNHVIRTTLQDAQLELKWIPVTKRLPDNADQPGAFCPRYQVATPYGVTEGWYKPHDHGKGGQWFALFWFMSQTYEIWNIDFERGDVPKVIGEAPVMAWRPLPERYQKGVKD